MEYNMNGVPMFNDHNGLEYESWRRSTHTFLQAHGYDIWYSVLTLYNGSKKLNTTSKKELKKNNKIEMDFIIEGLPNLVKDKVGKFSLAK
jgi:hypothetical protein